MGQRSAPAQLAPRALCIVALLVAAGCGGDSDDGGVTPSAEPRGTVNPNKDPFAATCEEFLNTPDLYSQGTVKLARRVRLSDANEYQVTLRLRNAITDICDNPGRSDYPPGHEAVRAVKAGKYKTAKG
jgi:hypothetical protein